MSVLWSDNRASSIGFEYMMTFTVALLLLSGMTVALGDVTERQEQQVTLDHFEYVGSEIHAQLQQQQAAKVRHDRESSMLDAVGGSQPTAYESLVYVDLPKTVGANTYSVQVSPDGDELVITSSQLLIEHRTPINPEIPVRPNSGAPGGEVGIVYDSASDEFVIDAIGDLT